MFNLLPQEQKRFVAFEYRFRLVIVGLLLFGALGTIAVTTLIPSFSLAYHKEKMALAENHALKEEIALHSDEDFSRVLSEAKLQLEALSTGTDDAYVYELVSDVVRNKTASVQIVGIHTRADTAGGRAFTVSGIARNRNALLEFVKILEHESSFSGVTVPVSNFAAETDIDFSIFVHTK